MIARCAANLFVDAPPELRPSFWFTGAMFVVYDLILVLRVVTAGSLPTLVNPFNADMWQSLVFMATIVMPIGWTFGFFMMTNARLTLELRKAELDLREMAATDFLTGALNRRAFLEMSQREAERARRNGQPMLLLTIDIDYFKEFNDTYGHLAGDEMLCGIVATFRANLRSMDLLVRWGGDEFVILLPDTGLPGGAVVAEKLRQAVADMRLPVNSLPTRSAISVGGALWRPGEDAQAVFRRADGAVYQAKERGRNCVVMAAEGAS